MATINLGAIKFNWQGAYNGATAYTVDDVVESGGSTYVCIAATTGNTPPNATYWELMSQKGIDADLINISGTVQGDIYYNNGSAIARLAPGTSGNFLKTQGSGANPIWDAAGGGLQSMQVFTSSGTWTKPSGITKVKVYVTGGGGGGGGGHANWNHGGGGGAGGTAIKWITSGLGSTETVTIGNGGNGGGGSVAGQAGQASSFGAFATGNGGGAGPAGQNNPSGQGGSATGGDINIYGGYGHPAGGGAGSNDETSAGVGGGSYWGGGGAAANHADGSTGAGANADAYGAGGGGGDDVAGTSYAGGNGKSGIVVVEEY